MSIWWLYASCALAGVMLVAPLVAPAWRHLRWLRRQARRAKVWK